jgi:peroxidase
VSDSFPHGRYIENPSFSSSNTLPQSPITRLILQNTNHILSRQGCEVWRVARRDKEASIPEDRTETQTSSNNLLPWNGTLVHRRYDLQDNSVACLFYRIDMELCRLLPQLVLMVLLQSQVIIHSNSAVLPIFNTTFPDDDYYSLNGSGNNQGNHRWGAAATPRVRLLPAFAASEDPIVNSQLPSARRIMEELFRKVPPLPNKGSNHLMLEFGQFISQDIIGATKSNLSEYYPIPCDGQLVDWVFCPAKRKYYSVGENGINIVGEHDAGAPMIRFWRTQHSINRTSGVRSSINTQSSFLDMSNLYGIAGEEVVQVRSFQDGLLQLDEQGMPPIFDRFDSSPGLLAVYITFMRYHNLLAKDFRREDPTATDEELYRQAKRRNIAVYQSIVEQKYIPTLLGAALDPYEGYKAESDPRVDEFFAAVAFRYAHSSVSQVVRIIGHDWKPEPKDPLFLRDLMRASPLEEDQVHIQEKMIEYGGVEVFLRGLTLEAAKEVDASFADDMNLWSEAVSVMDIQRSRDVRIPPYNQVRESMGMPSLKSLEDLVSGYNNSETARVVLEALQDLYENDVGRVDAYVGALIERPIHAGAFMGPLLFTSIKDQFSRLRNGDRFWYKNQYSPEIYQSFPTIAEVIRQTAHSNLDDFPEDAFRTWDGPNRHVDHQTATCDTGTSKTQLSLLSGEFGLGWSVYMPNRAERNEDPLVRPTIDVTLSTTSPMNGPGYLAVGWRSQEMKGSEMWICEVLEDAFYDYFDSPEMPSTCPSKGDISQTQTAMFFCCMMEGKMHIASRCAVPADPIFYELEVLSWCLTPEMSSVTIRAPVCDMTGANSNNGANSIDCFRLNSPTDNSTKQDFIVAYNPNEAANHGYMRRTAAQVDLVTGILTQSEIGTAGDGLIATHGLFMLIGWMVVAPLAIFVSLHSVGEVLLAWKSRNWKILMTRAVIQPDCEIHEDKVLACGGPHILHGIHGESDGSSSDRD